MSMRTGSNQQRRSAHAAKPPDTAKTVRMRIADRNGLAHLEYEERKHTESKFEKVHRER